jgi:hypothetical protein
MNVLTTPGVQHLVAGLATIGALAALAATGAVPGNDALVPIVAIGSALVGGGIATSSATQASAATAAAIPTVAPVAAPPVAT